MNPIKRYDFTYHLTEPEVSDEETMNEGRAGFIKFFTEYCDRWVFQLEKGEESGRLHYQGRFSLKVKTRLTTLTSKKFFKEFHCHLSPTHVTDGNFDYVMKEESRVDGPWRDENGPKPAPILNSVVMLDQGLLPWQQTLFEMSQVYDSRTIDIIYDPRGNIGKTVFTRWMKHHGHAHRIPSSLQSSKDIMQMVMSVIRKRGERKVFIIDFPKSITHAHHANIWSAIEDIKGGFAYDTRYAYDDLDFNEPRIFVFTNTLPPKTFMSEDRWRYWIVNVNTKELTRYDPAANDYWKNKKGPDHTPVINYSDDYNSSLDDSDLEGDRSQPSFEDRVEQLLVSGFETMTEPMSCLINPHFPIVDEVGKDISRYGSMSI